MSGGEAYLYLVLDGDEHLVRTHQQQVLGVGLHRPDDLHAAAPLPLRLGDLLFR